MKKKKQPNCTLSQNPERIAVRVSMVSIMGNAILTLFKILAGILGHSGAMISDAINSASDVASGVIVMIGIRISTKDSDREHPYGHERFECVVAIVLSIILLISGLFIGHNAIEQLSDINSADFAIPNVLALIVAVISIVSKEVMYWYTRHFAKRLESTALMATAWDHRSDALSSIGAFVGILGARMGFPALDTIASLVICAFIIKAAYDIFVDAIGKMVDHACSKETEAKIAACATEEEGVLGVDHIRTRVFGNRIYVDIEICANGELSLQEGHEIAERVHRSIEEKFEKVKHITVHVNPAQDQHR